MDYKLWSGSVSCRGYDPPYPEYGSCGKCRYDRVDDWNCGNDR